MVLTFTHLHRSDEHLRMFNEIFAVDKETLHTEQTYFFSDITLTLSNEADDIRIVLL